MNFYFIVIGQYTNRSIIFNHIKYSKKKNNFPVIFTLYRFLQHNDFFQRPDTSMSILLYINMSIGFDQ